MDFYAADVFKEKIRNKKINLKYFKRESYVETKNINL